MIEALKSRYRARERVYAEYYANPRNRVQEECFGRSIVQVIDEVAGHLEDFQHPEWVDCVSNLLYHRWYIGVLGREAYLREHGEAALLRYWDPESALVWGESLTAALTAERDPAAFDGGLLDPLAKERAASLVLPDDLKEAFDSLCGGFLLSGDWLLPDNVEYVTYLQTVAHDFVDLADALLECGCGAEHDWHLLIDIIAAHSNRGFVAKAAHRLGITAEALQTFFTLAMERAQRLAAAQGKGSLACPVID